MKKLVSIVVPVHNEAAIIRANLLSILQAAAGEDIALELIAVDDGSKDASAAEVRAAAQDDPRIRLLSFTRNFGKEAAILAGLNAARGEAAIVLDADLQHPPALIPQMLALWQQGLRVVEAVKVDRGNEGRSDSLFARSFYSLFNRLAGMDLANHSDFKLLDRVVIDAYLAFPERHRFFRGLISWAGFPSARLPFTVQERSGGDASWSKIKLAKYAIANITSFSSLPLKLVSVIGGATLLFGLIIAAINLVQKFQGKALSGFTTVNLLIIIFGGGIMLSVGIIGHYVAHLYDEIKRRPHYLINPEATTLHERSLDRTDRHSL